MNGRRVVLGLAVLSALIFSAFSAASASANTANACVASAGSPFSGAHCLSGGTGFKHVEIAPNTPTAITGTNAATATNTTVARTSILKGTAAGIETEIQCTTVSGTGSMENKEEGATMWAQGTGTITYSGCTVTKPAGKSCVVKGGEVKTKELSATTKGLTNQLEFTPKSGTEFASITIEKCTVAGLNNTFPVIGSVRDVTTGATTTSTHTEVTTENKLKFAGQKAGLDGALTIKNGSGQGLVVT